MIFYCLDYTDDLVDKVYLCLLTTRLEGICTDDMPVTSYFKTTIQAPTQKRIYHFQNSSSGHKNYSLHSICYFDDFSTTKEEKIREERTIVYVILGTVT